MTIVYRPDDHSCDPPRRTRHPHGTLFRCDACGRYWVSNGNYHWVPPFPFGPTARRIKRIEAER